MHDALASKRLLHIDAGAAPAYTVPTRPVQMESGFNTTAVGRVALALPIFSRCQLLRAHLARSQNQTIAATTRGVRPDILAQIHLIRLECVVRAAGPVSLPWALTLQTPPVGADTASVS